MKRFQRIGFVLLTLLCLQCAGNAETFKNNYQVPVDAIDPVQVGANQLVIYSPAVALPVASGDSQTVVVTGETVQAFDSEMTEIPPEGFVIRASGSATQWMRKFLKPGALVSLDADRRRLTVQLTPASMVYDLNAVLLNASKESEDSPIYQQSLAEAERCRDRLDAYGDIPLNSEINQLAEQCQRLANLAYYHAIPAPADKVHGTWIRPESVSSAQIDKALDKLKAANITDIFLETYYQGKTIYPSAVMREYGLAEQHPRYRNVDVLQLWVDGAHARGMKLHAWTQVFFAGNSEENLEQYGPILHTYPAWRNVQKPQWATPMPVVSNIEHGHYFLDPANADVRAYLNKLILEIASYPVDGINLDYIRYPSSGRVSAPNYLTTTWGYSDTARKQFSAMIQAERAAAKSTDKSSTDPKDLTLSSPLWPRWVEWRKAQVTNFVKGVSDNVHALNPNILISAVVFPHSDPTFAQKCQDYPRWVQEGSIQALTPIGLSENLTTMTAQSQEFKQLTQEKIPVYIGIFGLYNRISPLDLASQIDTAYQAHSEGVVLFDGNRLDKAYQEALVEGPFRANIVDSH